MDLLFEGRISAIAFHLKFAIAPFIFLFSKKKKKRQLDRVHYEVDNV